MWRIYTIFAGIKKYDTDIMDIKLYSIIGVGAIIAVLVLRHILLGLLPLFIGKWGEKHVAKILRKLSSKKYRVMNDIMLSTQYGTTQIDHIVVSKYGIFVIETKNYKGKISGGKFSYNWTQKFFYSENFFVNPVKQNAAHINVLSHVLKKYNNLPFISIIVFSDRAKLKTDVVDPHVIKWDKLKKTIKKYKEELIDETMLDDIVSTIRANSIDPKEGMKEHISDIKERVKEKEKKIAAGTCPVCGSKLKIMDGKYGKFYACTNYPDCKFTKNIR